MDNFSPFGKLRKTEQLALLEAWAIDRQQVQYRHKEALLEWRDINVPSFEYSLEYRIKPIPTEYVVDWIYIPKKWKWFAEDKSGLICLYTVKPYLNVDQGSWCVSSPDQYFSGCLFTEWFGSEQFYTVKGERNYQSSLVERP